MGNFCSSENIIDEELLATYVELTYLRRSEIQRIINLLDDVNPGKLHNNLQYRFTTEEVDVILPGICCSPFRQTIYRVFSSKRDDHLSLEDILDLCSAFSENCPESVRVAWAFHIFDFDGDNQISLHDVMEVTRRLLVNIQEEFENIDIEHIAQMMFQEVSYNQLGNISAEEFMRFSSRIPDLLSSFQFKI
ncbi:calcium and integrin-binding family member 3 [Xylocopa sonorina]|uniref:calcium and integrin-binding family member 3 n=1 Tax=Xylocopa sonorina TaxID=1818115 RepID=UPI00403ACE58